MLLAIIGFVLFNGLTALSNSNSLTLVLRFFTGAAAGLAWGLIAGHARRVVPVAQNKISFALSGAGKIIGVGNGDPNCHEPDVFISEQPRWSRSLFNGLAQVLVQSALGWRWCIVV